MSATGASRANAAADSDRVLANRLKAKAPAKELGNFHKKRSNSGYEGDRDGEGGGSSNSVHDGSDDGKTTKKPPRPKRERGNFMSATGASKANSKVGEARMSTAKVKIAQASKGEEYDYTPREESTQAYTPLKKAKGKTTSSAIDNEESTPKPPRAPRERCDLLSTNASQSVIILPLYIYSNRLLLISYQSIRMHFSSSFCALLLLLHCMYTTFLQRQLHECHVIVFRQRESQRVARCVRPGKSGLAHGKRRVCRLHFGKDGPHQWDREFDALILNSFC